MIKQTILYAAISGMCLLTACQKEDYEPATVTDKDILSLTVCATDFAVSGGVSTRAADNGKTTTFENGDRVGVIVLDASGALIADNLPYKYNGSVWNFDTGNGEGKQPIYYDPSMTSYIVYYPYDATANNIASVDDLKALDAFTLQTNQSTEDAYRKSDLMVWSSTGTPMKRITATLTHVHASFSLAPMVQWTLATGDKASYIPPVLEDVIISDKDGKSLIPYRAEDGSYRYILPDDYTGNLRWFYTYRGKTFGGEYEVTGSNPGTRYAQVEIADMGEYTLDMAVMGDFYCSAEADGGKNGYIIPQEAVSVLDAYNCIGIVFYVGKHEKDNSDYTVPLTENGPVLADGKVHGYAVALTDVHNSSSDRLRWENGPNGEYNQRVDASTDYTDWNGYANCLKIHEFVKKNSSSGWDIKHFPAALACETYGNRIVDQNGNTTTAYAWQQPFIAPKNSSGWFLPSCDQLYYCWQNRTFLSNCINMVKNKTSDTTLKNHIGWFSTSWYYWSSAEDSSYSGYAWNVDFYRDNRYAYYKNYTTDVRAVLAF